MTIAAGSRAAVGLERTKLVPLIVPLTLIRPYVRRFGLEYLGGHVYLVGSRTRKS